MSEEIIKQPKPRLTSWLKQRFGEGILEELRKGKKTIKFNGNTLNPNDKNFRDKRVTGTTEIEIIHEAEVLRPEPISDKNKTGLAVKDISKEEKKSEVQNFLTSDQIKSVKEGKANVFIDGLATTLDKELDMDNNTEPMLDGKRVTIKVLPQFGLG